MGSTLNIALQTQPAHPIDIFSLAVTSNQVLSASGASAIKIHSTKDADFPLVQTLEAAHKIGCHHVVTARDGHYAASIGFDGEIKVWASEEGTWSEVTSLSSKFPLYCYYCFIQSLTQHPRRRPEAD